MAEHATLLWWGTRPLEEEQLAEDEEKKAARQARAALLRWSKVRSELDVGLASGNKIRGDDKMVRLTRALLAARPTLDARGALVHRPPPSSSAVASADQETSQQKPPTAALAAASKEAPVTKSVEVMERRKIAEQGVVKIMLSRGALETAGIEWCAKRRAEKRRERRREFRGARALDESFAPPPPREIPPWYVHRRARVRWERLARGTLEASWSRRRRRNATTTRKDASAGVRPRDDAEDLWRGFVDALVRAASWAHGDATLSWAHVRAAADRSSRTHGCAGKHSCASALGRGPRGPTFGGAQRPEPGTAAGGAPGHHTKRIVVPRGEAPSDVGVPELLPRFPGGYGVKR